MSTVLFKSDNVYVIIREADIDSSNVPKEVIISSCYGQDTTSLYGGRIFLKGLDPDSWQMCIAGHCSNSIKFQRSPPALKGHIYQELYALYLRHLHLNG